MVWGQVPPRLVDSSVYELAEKKGIDMPITKEVYRVLFDEKSPEEATNTLMLRPPRDE